MTRISELAIQAANDTNGISERIAITISWKYNGYIIQKIKERINERVIKPKRK